jgi:hypothetical protein
MRLEFWGGRTFKNGGEREGKQTVYFPGILKLTKFDL